ncbi:MAG: ATPase, T2SS/T4P/T4SS family [Thermoproteus sp.]
MQGIALIGLVRLIELGYIDENDKIARYKDDIINIISRIYSRNIDKTIYLRYKLFYKLTKDRSAALYYLTKSLNIDNLHNLLINKNIEDIILIPGKYIYITTKFGKQRTDIYATGDLVARFLSLARAKGYRLLQSNPSFKYGLALGPLRLRISVDLPPIVSAPHVYIRVHRGVKTLDDLVLDGFLNRDHIVTIRREVLANRRDLVVAGPPGSGKTTLLQAIDLELPHWLQRVYIDEADEFIDSPILNQIKINSLNKLKEIFTSMNRNIDLFIIGELQYPEHFEAYRSARSIGLQSFGTMHATDLGKAKKRLAEANIDLENIVIIQLKKKYENKIIRYIDEIYVG